MPALITHDTFGQDVYDRLRSTIGARRDEAEAFLLGNQGPDPLFYSLLVPRLRAFNQLGTTMHNEKPNQLLAALKNSLDILDEDEQRVGRAYALGFLCHYTLDSAMHPLVFFQEYRLCDAGEPGLSRSNGGEVHAVIESEFDEMVLFTRQGQTVATFDPSQAILRGDAFVLATISKMYTYLALTVYGILIPPAMFSSSLKSFRVVQRLFHSATGTKRAILGRIEELVRPYSFYRSMSHRPREITESEFDNHEHALWENPFTGESESASFWNIYDDAVDRAVENIDIFLSDGFDAQMAHEVTRDLDFSGKPTVAAVLSVQDPDAQSDSSASV